MKRFFGVIVLLIAMASAMAQSVTNVGVMLPLHNVNGDGKRMIEYYRGMLLAINQLKSDGMNINVHAWNVAEDSDPRAILLQNGATDCQVIFGPLYTKQVKAIGDFCKAYNIRMVIPFSINGNDVDKNPQICQVYQSNDDIYTTSIQRIAENFKDFHPVIIDCNDTTSQKGAFTFGLREVLQKNGRTYNITNLRSSEEMFAKAFSLTQPNVVILNTGRAPELRMALDKLDALVAANRNVSVTLYGYTEWLMYAKHNKDRYAKYNTYVPTTFYYNEYSPDVQKFEADYRKAFGEDMMYALPHFAATGYDHTMYFLAGKTHHLQTPFKFEKTNNGGWRNKEFMLIHYKQDGTIESIEY